MATETNKKAASDEENTGSAKVGEGSSAAEGRTLTAHPGPQKKPVFIVLAVVALILGISALLGQKVHIGNKVYAQAAGHKIYKEDVKALIGDAKGVSDRQAATVLADKYLTEALAKEQGVTVNDSDMVAAYGSTITKEKSQDKYSYQLQLNQLYFDKLQVNNQGDYRGYLLVGHFSRNIPFKPVTAERKAAEPNLGNAAAIAADKKYAQDFLTNLYDQIKSGKITWDQAAQLERGDRRIGDNMYPSLSHSGPFDTAKAPVSLFDPESAQQKLRELKSGQTSKPFVVSLTDTENPDTNQPVESYFLVVRMDASSGGKSGLDFQQELQQAKKRLGYEVNV